MRNARTSFVCFSVLLLLVMSMGAGSAGAALPKGMKKFETTKVADGVYSFRFFFHRTMFVVTDEGVIVGDPINGGAAKVMMGEIKKVTDKPVKYVLYSHEHWDHASGGGIFKKAGAKFVSHAKCAAAWKENPSPAVVMPDETYEGGRHEITLGGKTVELLHFGRSHGNCMTVMRLPKEKILFVVDLVTPKRVFFRGMADSSPGGWLKTLRELEKLDVERIIPGHGPPSAPASAIREVREFLEDLIAAVQAAMKKSQDVDAVKKMVKLPKYEKWSQYKDWLEMNVERIFTYLRVGA